MLKIRQLRDDTDDEEIITNKNLLKALKIGNSQEIKF
jgi:hypothetical protein